MTSHLSTGSWRAASVRLNVHYAPSVRIDTAAADLGPAEADVDAVAVRCLADANPEPDVIWRKDGGEAIFSIGNMLAIAPVRANDNATYFCRARNQVAHHLVQIIFGA